MKTAVVVSTLFLWTIQWWNIKRKNSMWISIQKSHKLLFCRGWCIQENSWMHTCKTRAQSYNAETKQLPLTRHSVQIRLCLERLVCFTFEKGHSSSTVVKIPGCDIILLMLQWVRHPKRVRGRKVCKKAFPSYLHIKPFKMACSFQDLGFFLIFLWFWQFIRLISTFTFPHFEWICTVTCAVRVHGGGWVSENRGSFNLGFPERSEIPQKCQTFPGISARTVNPIRLFLELHCLEEGAHTVIHPFANKGNS